MTTSIVLSYGEGKDLIETYGEVEGLSASWRSVGGCWQMSFSVVGDGNHRIIPTNVGERWLNKDIEIPLWGWFGVVAEVSVTIGRVTYRYALNDGYANKVAIVYENSITSWETDGEENDRYGDWEFVEKKDDMKSAAATTYRGKVLARRKSINPHPSGIVNEHLEHPTVEIVCYGYLPLCARFASGYWAVDGSSIGYNGYSKVSTTLQVDASEGTSTLEVGSAANFTAGDIIGVVTDNDKVHYAEVLSTDTAASPDQIELISGEEMPSGFKGTTVAASSGALVFKTSVAINDVSGGVSMFDGIIADTDLSVGEIADDTTEIHLPDFNERNAWSRMEALALWESPSKYFLNSDRARRVHLVEVSDSLSEPAYYIRRHGIFKQGSGKPCAPHECRPGFYRDTRLGRSVFIHEVSVRDGDDHPAFSAIGPDLEVE